MCHRLSLRALDTQNCQRVFSWCISCFALRRKFALLLQLVCNSLNKQQANLQSSSASPQPTHQQQQPLATPMRLIALLAVLGATYASFDCDAGCSTTYDPVCGLDGTTFANECLAFCQKIAVASAGTCGNKKSTRLAALQKKPEAVREDGIVTLARHEPLCRRRLCL
jgi:Kazal-type serine protease inhibitor domain